MNNRIRTYLVAAVAATGASLSYVPAAHAQSISTTGTFLTFGGIDNLCVHAVSTTTPGAVESVTCNGSANQEWTGTNIGANAWKFALKSNPTLCLASTLSDPTSTSSTIAASTQTCTTSTGQQEWWFGSGGQLSMYFYQNYCLDVLAGQTTSGQEMDITSCNATGAQNFWPAGMAVTFFATNDKNGNVLDVDADGDTPGVTTLDTYTYGSTNPAQKFTLTTGHQIMHTGRNGRTTCIDVMSYGGPNESADNGNLFMNTCSGAASQQWFFANLSKTPLANPLGEVVNGQFGPGTFDFECLDIDGDDSNAGGFMDTFTCNSTSAQTWNIVIAQQYPL